MASIAQVLAEFKNETGFSPNAQLIWPGSETYIQITTSYYWSSSEQNPQLIFEPDVPQDVAIALKLIATGDKSVIFAVKGGGHIADPGFNSTAGILIDMALFTQINYNQDTQCVDIGPGLVWEQVYKVLNASGRNVAGASTCQGVGVAGFNLGGGFSNKTNQYGLALDSIMAIDVVLPTGDIVTADPASNADLFWALKGGGNNYGIVTNWTMITHAQGPIYSTVLKYQPEFFAQLVPAIIQFSKQEVPKSNVEAIFEYTGETPSDKVVIVAEADVECFFDGEEPPSGLFDVFLNIPHTVQNISKTWADRQKNLPGRRQTYRKGRPNGIDDLPLTFRGRFSSVMVSNYTAPLINQALTLASTFANLYFGDHGGVQIYPDIWPFLPTMFDNSSDAGWPHFKGQPNGPLVINFKWEGEENDEFWLDKISFMTATLRELAISEGCSTNDTPFYLNLALETVTVSEIYRENLDKLTALHGKYDPSNVMNRTGGFRIPG